MINLKLFNKALMDANLNGNEFKMYCLILNNCSFNKTNSIEMYNGFFMDKLGLGERQIQRTSKSLEEKKYIKIIRCANSVNKNANIYQLVFDDKNVTPYKENIVATKMSPHISNEDVENNDKNGDINCDKNVTPYKYNLSTKENINNNSIVDKVPSTGTNKVKENISKIISNMNNFISDIREFNADCTKAVENGKAAIKYYERHKTSASVKQRAIIEEQIENFQKALKDRKKYIGNNLSEEERKKLDPATEEYQISIGHKVVWNYDKALQFAKSIAAGDAKTEECISQMNEYVEWHTAATTPEVVQTYKKIFTDMIKELRGLQTNNEATNSSAAVEDKNLPF